MRDIQNSTELLLYFGFNRRVIYDCSIKILSNKESYLPIKETILSCSPLGGTGTIILEYSDIQYLL